VKKAPTPELFFTLPITPLSVPHLLEAGVTESSHLARDSIAPGYATYLLCPLWVISGHPACQLGMFALPLKTDMLLTSDNGVIGS
jgi:hypothetical protein